MGWWRDGGRGDGGTVGRAIAVPGGVQIMEVLDHITGRSMSTQKAGDTNCFTTHSCRETNFPASLDY